MDGLKIRGDDGLNWWERRLRPGNGQEAQPWSLQGCTHTPALRTHSPKVGLSCLPRQGPARPDLGRRHQRGRAAGEGERLQRGLSCPARAWLLSGNKPAPEREGAQPPAPPLLRPTGWRRCRDPPWGGGRVLPQGAEPLLGRGRGWVASPSEWTECSQEHTRGLKYTFQGVARGPCACPGGAPCVWMWTPPSPDHTHTHGRVGTATGAPYVLV